MWETLLFVYMVNTMLLIIHEMDAAYWKEWKLFNLGGGIDCFLVIHFPLMLIVLYGLVLVSRHEHGGLLYSLLVCAAGIFAFGVHYHFNGQGKPGFTSVVSRVVLIGTVVVSFAQAVITLLVYFGA